MIDAEVEHSESVHGTSRLADRYAQRSDWDPREANGDYWLFVLAPQRIQAWREANEIAGRTLMRHGQCRMTPDGAPRVPCTFRSATVADACAVTELVHDAYRHYVTLIGVTPGPMQADYRTVIEHRHVVLAESAGRIVGLIVLHAAADDFVVENVAVHPGYQGHGLGSALLQLAETTARQFGQAWIRLYTHEKMTKNLRRYRNRGYTDFAPADPIAPVLVHMRKPLPTTGPAHPIPYRSLR